METFSKPKDFVDDPFFARERKAAIAALPQAPIDTPLLDLIGLYATIPFLYTMQSCWGHFVFPGQNDPHSLAPLPDSGMTCDVEYRIAYIAFCIQNSDKGRRFRDALHDLTEIDREYVQFGSADWFWDSRVNTYQLQIEPDRFKYYDKAIIPFSEALYIEDLKARFFSQLTEVSKSLFHR